MMYFCPCSCNDPIDPETEESTLVALPRNLSYVQESYLDRYSVSARFVHNPKIERTILHQQSEERRANVEVETLNLLSAIHGQEFPVRGDSDFHDVPVSIAAISSSSAGFCVTRAVDTPSQTAHSFSSKDGCAPTTGNWSSSGSSPFSAPSLLQPASRVVSRLSSLLHSPPNESMDSARDIGTSVDGDSDSIDPPQAEAAVTTTRGSGTDTSPLMECPQSLGEEMDRGVVKFTTYSRSNSSDSERDEMLVGGTMDIERDDEVMEKDDSVVEKDDNRGDSNMEVMFQEDSSLRPFGTGGKTHYPFSDIKDTVKTHSSHETVVVPSESVVSHETVVIPTESVVSHETVVIPTESVVSGEITGNPGTEVSTKPGVGPSTSYGSPDSDVFSEEGVFVNMEDMDDSLAEKSGTVSEVSDDTCISADSMFLSPEEGELEEEQVQEPSRKMTLQEAISRAASDLSRMSVEMYGPAVASTSAVAMDSQDEDEEEASTSSSTPNRTPRFRFVRRSSPVRSSAGLKIKITDSSNSDSQSQLDDSNLALTESPIYPENEFNFSRVELRKSSSLKTNKTPPGTPHRKKVVRFADAMGLDLESVRHVLNMESPPRIPASAMADLQNGLSEDRKEIGAKYLCPCFGQPGAADNFPQRVLKQKVCLENAIITDLTITGFVRVANIAFHKSVRVRYTHNSWATFHDIAATYVQNSCDGPTDRFSFSIVAPAYFGPGNRLEFAVSFNAGGTEYWDNNEGKNYVFECFAKTVPTESETAWLHFL